MMSTSKKETHPSPAIRYAENRGRFIKPCPGTPRYVCCGYRIINIAQGCTIGCTYCILDHYFGSSTPVLFSNQDQLIHELEDELKTSEEIIRFGTGEFTDSLLHDDFYDVYRHIMPLISRSSNSVLEIKTKTVNIEKLLHMGHYDQVIVSWSLNSEYIAAQEERSAPPVEKRIEAAHRVEAMGYKLAFHFDPIIYHEGWKEGYRKTIDTLFRTVDPRNVVYVSMGTLRFIPEMWERLETRSTLYLQGDFIRGLDGKMRYFRPLRTKMYRAALSYLKQYIAEDRVYLCMENQDVWKDVFAIENMTGKQLALRLDQACLNVFPRLMG